MKEIILLITVFILNISTAHCQVDSSIDKATNQSQMNPYQVKAKKQKTAAWVCLGGGFAFAATGIILSTAKATTDVLYAFTLQETQSDYTGESILMITGAAAMAASIPLFIASGKNKQKAKLNVAFQKGSEGLPVALSKKIPGLTLSISM